MPFKIHSGNLLLETGFRPAIYYIATNTTIQQVTEPQKTDPKKQNKINKRETNANTGRSTKRKRPATAAPSGEFPPRA
jgi:hypothetical protein